VKKGDFLIIGIVILLALTPLLIPLLSEKSGDAFVRVSQDGEILYEGPITEDKVIETPNGSNRVIISGGEVYMEHADCKDQLCVSAGKATQEHPIICLPNKVTVTIVSGKEPVYDSVSG